MQFVAVNDALRSEAFGPAGCVSHIVTVRKEDARNATDVRDTAHQWLCETRRINQPVAVAVLHKIAGAAVRLLRMKATIEDADIEVHREIGNRSAHIVLGSRAYRGSRAGNQRVQCSATGDLIRWLRVHEGEAAGITENLRRKLAAGIAVNAGAVHEEVAGHVFGHRFSDISHLPIG